MILTTFDVDREIENKTLFLKFSHTNLKTGEVDWDAYEKERKIIVDEAWKKSGEIMKMELDSMIEDAEAQVGADLRYAEYMCSKHTRSSDFPLWAFLFLVAVFYLTWAIVR